MEYITRYIERRIVRSLKSFSAVYIAGPRQSGKTTLVRYIAQDHHPASYISFDDIQTRSAAQRDPTVFLRSLKQPVVLDEIQLVPEIFRPLKILIDESRRNNNVRGGFLLTGSASVLTLPKLADALVGRVALHELLPFSAVEVSAEPATSFIDRAFATDWNFYQFSDLRHIIKMKDSSFPELLEIKDRSIRYEWCNSYLNTVLQRDVRILLDVQKIKELPNLLQLLAIQSGGLLNVARLARNAGLNHVTIKKYLVLLESLFLILTLPAWSFKLKKRLIKTPKVYLTDLNLLLHLLRIDLTESESQMNLIFGQILENFVAVEISKQATFSDTRIQLFHYRTSSGQEVDFLLEGPQGSIVGIEVKSTSNVTSKDFRHLESLRRDLGEKFVRGFVVYPGTDIVPFGEQLFAVPLASLWTEIG